MTVPPRTFALLLSLLVVSFAPARAETLVDDPGRYTVDIPQPVTRSNSESASPSGKFANFVLTHETGTTAEIVQYSDFAAGTLTGQDLAKLYERAAKGGAANAQGTIRSLVVCQLGEVEGREMLVDLTANQAKCVCRARFYVVGDRLYQLLYVGPAGTENDADVMHFFNSFRLLR